MFNAIWPHNVLNNKKSWLLLVPACHEVSRRQSINVDTFLLFMPERPFLCDIFQLDLPLTSLEP